jgi:hypothetical protein
MARMHHFHEEATIPDFTCQSEASLCEVQDIYSFGIILWEVLTWEIPLEKGILWQV